MLFFLVLICWLFGYGVHKYRQDPSNIEDNYSIIFDGMKDQWYHKFFHFAYHLRKILFAAIIVATVFNQRAEGGLMLAIISLLGLFVLILRPYREHIRNLVHLGN